MLCLFQNKQLEEMKKKLRDELTEEYERRLGEAEQRLKTELASREAIEASLSNELQAKDSLLDGEKKKLQDTLEILESELQCSICSELFINVSKLENSWPLTPLKGLLVFASFGRPWEEIFWNM